MVDLTQKRKFLNTGITVTQIPVFGIEVNTGIPEFGIGIGSFTRKLHEIFLLEMLFDRK